MSSVRVICLGNRQASDDGAALQVAEALTVDELLRAGRPGAGLLDLLDTEKVVVLLDVTQSDSPPGTIHSMTLSELAEATIATANLSSHGFGPAQTLQLGRALGRPLPKGTFIGVEGACFDPGDTLSTAVEAALPAFLAAIRDAIIALGGRC